MARKKFIDEHPEWVQKWVDGHREIIEWMNGNYPRAKRIFNEEFERETGKALPPDYLDRFFARVSFTAEPLRSQVLESAKRAYEIGYLGKNKLELDGLYDLSFLEKS